MRFVALPKAPTAPYQNIGSGRVLQADTNVAQKRQDLLIEMPGRPQRLVAFDLVNKVTPGTTVVVLRDSAGGLFGVAESDFTSKLFIELGDDLKPLNTAAADEE